MHLTFADVFFGKCGEFQMAVCQNSVDFLLQSIISRWLWEWVILRHADIPKSSLKFKNSTWVTWASQLVVFKLGISQWIITPPMMLTKANAAGNCTKFTQLTKYYSEIVQLQNGDWNHCLREMANTVQLQPSCRQLKSIIRSGRVTVDSQVGCVFWDQFFECRRCVTVDYSRYEACAVWFDLVWFCLVCE